MIRIAVLGDIHGLAQTYESALRDARREGFDYLVILGDLLTYGVEPRRTLDLTFDAVESDEAVLILGNHDQLYLDRGRGERTYLDALPDWIRESVEWTCEQTGEAASLSQLEWRNTWVQGQLLFAHANPYGDGDWQYLSTSEEMQVASRTLAERGFRWGVFGHTHRFRRHEGGPAALTTVGSLGQPRDQEDRAPQWAMIELGPDRLDVTSRPVAFDRDAHLQAIRSTGLSGPTQDRLCGFFL